MRLATFVFLVSTFIISNANAGGFSLRGFEQGMSVEEASIVAEKNRGKLIGSENINGNYTFDEGKTADDIFMSFCTKNNKGLYSISYTVSLEEFMTGPTKTYLAIWKFPFRMKPTNA